MKKSIYFFSAALLCTSAIIAKTITSDVAQTVAANFIQQKANLQVKSQSLAYSAISPAGDALFYAFNINPNGNTSGNGMKAADGFVIVVADDANAPVIGYSTEGAFVVPPAGSNAGYWMEQRKNEIISNRTNNVQPTAEISAQWTAYINNRIIEDRTTSSVSPLVQTTWDQPAPYNDLCPGGSVTGCVATTMAQIMRFWSRPTYGTGSSSYNSSYGTLSVNYASRTYHWTNMPYTGVTSSNDVDTLMYDCGVSVDMEYSPSGSGAWVTTYDDPSVCAQISYSKYFGYNPSTIKGLQRFNYADQDWINLIETDLNAGRPVQYVGYDPNAGGHTWVCDGYDSNNNLHMNWGWSGADDGYFSINTLNPGGSFNFSENHEVLVGIEPKAISPNDAGIPAVTSPAGTTCNLSITPVVRLQNFGTATLTSCTINYYYDSKPVNTYSWTGSLASNAYINVTLPAIAVTSGTHSFTSYTTYPNDVTDGNTANDKSTGSFTIAGSPPALPMTQGFEGNSFLPTGWSVWNPDGDVTWQVVTTVAHTGSNCIGMNNCDGNGSTDMTGMRDRFMTIPYDFTGHTTASLAFDVAYAPCTLSGQIYADTLVVYYSTDCGTTWTSCYQKGGVTLATAPTFDVGANNGCWSPTTSQWRTDVTDVSVLHGQASVMFAFENRSGWGEWLYLDNINLSGATVTGINAIPAAVSFRIYPNPANTLFTVEGPATSKKVQYSLYNVVGEELRAGEIATDGNHFSQNIEVGGLAHGLYLLRVTDNQQSWATKVDVQ